MSDQLPVLMVPEEVAKLLRMSARTVRRLAFEGKLPTVKLGKLLRFNRAQIEGIASGCGVMDDVRREHHCAAWLWNASLARSCDQCGTGPCKLGITRRPVD